MTLIETVVLGSYVAFGIGFACGCEPPASGSRALAWSRMACRAVLWPASLGWAVASALVRYLVEGGE